MTFATASQSITSTTCRSARVKLAGNAGGLAGKLAGGWKVIGVTTFRSGLPLIPTIAQSNCNSAFMQTCRPNLIGPNFGMLSGSGVDQRAVGAFCFRLARQHCRTCGAASALRQCCSQYPGWQRGK